MVRVLEQRNFPVSRLRLLSSERGAGSAIPFHGTPVTVETLGPGSFEGIDVTLFSAGGPVSRAVGPEAVKAGAIVIDNSSAFRMQPGVPLVIPEINPDTLAGHRGLISNPNCSTILFLMAVYPIHRKIPIRRAVVCTYQSVSGSGRRGLEELASQERALSEGLEPVATLYPRPIAHNVLPFVERIMEGGFTPEELKLHNETMKILDNPSVMVTATCVRVPVPRAHSEAIHIELAEKMPVDRARELLSRAPGVRLVDDPDVPTFPTPLEATGGDDVLVGRVREDLAFPSGLALFACMDQIRKGAALNAVQIGEELLRRSLL
jgi:aspartate-semialdehyde dehydrogenase